MRIQTRIRLACLAVLLLNAGCGGGSGEPVDSTSDAGSDDVADATDRKPDVTELIASQSWELWLRDGLQFADDDGDGIANADDPYPDLRPIFAEPDGSRSLDVLSAWTEFEDIRLDGVAVEGQALRLELSGSAESYGGPVWVVAHTPQGLRATPASLSPDGHLSVVLAEPALEVHVVADGSRGSAMPLQSLRPEQPLLLEPSTAAMAGSIFEIRGRNLAGIKRAELGHENLTVVSASNDRVRVELPVSAHSNELRVFSDADFSNRFTVDFRKTTALRVAGDIELAQDEFLATWVDGERKTLRHGETLEIDTPAWQPRQLFFDIEGPGGIRSYSGIEAVVWPDQVAAELSAESTLLARVARVQPYLGVAGDEQWEQRRALLNEVLSTYSAQTYLSALREYIADRAAVPTEDALVDVFDAYTAMHAPLETGKTTAMFAANPTTPFGGLDEMIASTFTATDPDADKQGSETAAGYVYPPSAASQVFSDDYSQIAILRHEGTSLNRPGLRGFSGCAYSPAEADYKRQRDALADPFAKVWRSDLCMQVDGLVFVSAAIIKPGDRPIREVLDDIAAGKSNVKELVRRHSRAELVDTRFQYGPGGYYLRSNSGFPQCHMETCYVEIITSGYGAAYSNSLPPAEAAIVKTLRVRMWAEAFLTWMLSIAGADPTNTGVADCVRNGLLSGKSGFYTVAEQLLDRIDDVKDLTGSSLLDEVRAAIDETIAPWLRDFVSSRLGTQYVECFTDFQPADQLKSRVESKLLERAGLTAFSEVLTAVRNIGSAVLTPEKFLFKLQPRAEIQSFGPQVIDLNDPDDVMSFRGDWLIQLDTTAANSCSDDGWCPEVVFTDQYGFEVRFQTDPSHYVNVQSGCGVACTLILIPFSDLLSAIPSAENITTLYSGPLDVQLAIQGEGDEYASYPGGELRLPVPVRDVRLRTRPRLDSVSPPLAEPGESVTVKGTGITVYGDNPVFELKSRDRFMSNIPVVIDDEQAVTDSSVRLKIPTSITTGQYSIVMKPDPNLEGTSLPPLESSDRSPLLVLRDRLPLIVAGDTGVVRDDLMRIELLAVNDSQVFTRIPSRPLAWDLPTNATNPRVPPGTYVYGEAWDDCPDENGEPIGVTAPVNNVKVTCESPGSDNVCSISLRSSRDFFLVSENDTDVSKKAISATLARGESRQFFLEYPADRCQ